MKKTLLLLLMLAMMPAMMSAYDFEVDGIYYKINRDSVSVSVTNKNSSNSGAYIGHVSVPAEVIYNDMVYPVTMIGGYAFNKCSALTGIDLPNTIKEISRFSFMGCTALSHINIPDSVTFIGGQAFQSCRSLTELFIPASVQNIETMAFSYCYGLTSIVVDENNSYYDSRENCNAIIGKNRNELLAACVNTVIPNSVKRFERDAFNGFTWLTEVDMPDSLEFIGINAFYGCTGLTNIDFPSTLTTISDAAFAGCTGLTEVVLPESLQTLGGNVFMDCPELTSLFIPANVTSIGGSLLARDTKVNSIVVDPRNTKYDSRDNCNAIIDTRYNRLIEGCNYSTVPEGVRHIDSGAFAYCDKISDMELPSSLYTIGYGAFRGCSSLTSIHVPEGVAQINAEVFRDCSILKTVSLPSTLNESGLDHIGTYCFFGCDSLRDVICYAVKPPQIGPFSYGCFETSTLQNGTLYVPAGSIDSYKTANIWRGFSRIAAIGDINGDGNIAISDVTNLIDQLLNGGELPAYADVNGDGAVTIKDVTVLIDMLLSGH